MLRYRAAVVQGHFDYAQTVALAGQGWQGQPGIHLLTPLLVEGTDQAVLVDRGWVPAALAEPEDWAPFQTAGAVEISGRIQLSQPRLNAPPLAGPERHIFQVDLDRLQGQLPYKLLPLYIVQSPVSAQIELPFRREPDLRLNNGPHLGYALQWFAFTIILAGGYLKYVRQHQRPVSARKTVPISKPMEA
jgi:surfeit locus 1 family protein